MSQNRTIRAILALDYDKRALSGTQKAIDQLNTSLDATRKRALTVETAASGLKKELAELARQDAIEQIGRDFAKAGQEGRNFNASVRETVSRLRAVGASESEIRSVARAYQDATVAANQAAAATANVQAKQATQGALGIFGRNLKGLPALQISGNLSTDAIGKILQVVDAGLVNLGPAGIAAGVAVVGVGLVFSKFASDLEKYNQRIEAQAKAFFGALDEAFNLIFEGATSEEIKKAQAQAETDAAAAQAQLDFLNGLKQGYEALQTDAIIDPIVFTRNIGDSTRGFLAGQRFLEEQSDGNIQNFGQLESAYDAATIALDEANAAVAGFEVTLSSVEIAANDAAAAQAANQTRITNAIVQRSQIEAESYKFIETATRESAEARVNAAQDEINRLIALNENLRAVGGETADALIKENEARMQEQLIIRETTQALIDSNLTARERAGGAIFRIFDDLSDRTSSLISAVGDTGVLANASTEIFALQAKIQDAAAKTAQAIDAINAKLAEAEAKALTDRENGLRDAITKANDAREKQEIDHRDKLLAINAKANLAQNNAIGARDALAFYQAQQTRKTELSEEARNNKRRLQEIDKALKQQTELVTRRYNEQVDAARKAASAQIAIENQKLYVLNQQLNAEIQQINSANAARQTLNTNYWSAQLATDVAGANAGLSIVSQFWNGVLSTLSGGGIEHSSTPIIPNVVPYDGSSGGTADYSGLTVMQSPTNTNRIAGGTSAGNTAGGGGITINVPISGAGMTKRQLLREVDQRLNTTLTRAGYE